MACLSVDARGAGCDTSEVMPSARYDAGFVPYGRRMRGYEWSTKWRLLGWPLIHIAWGNTDDGKRLVARGWVAIGQFALGRAFALGQFAAAPLCIAQFGIGLACLAQFSIALATIAQFTTAVIAFAQIGIAWDGSIPMGLVISDNLTPSER